LIIALQYISSAVNTNPWVRQLFNGAAQVFIAVLVGKQRKVRVRINLQKA
jgi:hypothetical protein